MDPITHATLGASLSQLCFGKYAKHKHAKYIPWTVAVLASVTPDLDIFIAEGQQPLSLEFWHRHFTHSLIFIPIGALLVALFFLCFPSYRKHWKITLGAAFIGYGSHGLLDALTSYGTLLLWPWSNTRFSWDIIAIVDPLFTLPLLLGLVWSIIYQQQKWVVLGLLWVVLFLTTNALQHHRALLSLQDFAKQHQLSLYKVRAMPDLASSTYWRVIAKQKSNSCLLITKAYTPLWKTSTLTPLAEVPLYKTPLSSQLSSEIAVFSWFTNDYAIIAKTDPMVIADGRYTIGNQADQPLYSLWGIYFWPKDKHIHRLRMIVLKERCEKKN